MFKIWYNVGNGKGEYILEDNELYVMIGDYVITKDSYQFIINEVKVVKSGENKGKEYLVPFKYPATVEQLYKCILELEILKVKIETSGIEDLFGEFIKISNRINEEVRNYEKLDRLKKMDKE